MSAPTAVARSGGGHVPSGVPFHNGFSSVLRFGANPAMSIWVKQVKPPGIDGGDPVDDTTMENVTWRQMSARVLKTLTPVSCRAAYNIDVYTQSLTVVNINTNITAWFPTGSNITFYGYLKSFQPADLVDGTQPEADLEVIPTNMDPSDGSEAAPVIVTVPGT